MRNLRLQSLFASAALLSIAAAPVLAQTKMPRPSPNATVMQTVGITDISLKYCRPAVKGREIWGKLVPYGQVWRTGANEAPTITTTDAIQVEGKELPAGTYALFTIPTTDAWTVIFSKQTDIWGSTDYKQDQDVLRVNVKPQPADFEERMSFEFESVAIDAAELDLRWAKLRVPVQIKVNTNELVLKNARAAISAAKPDEWRPYYSAANYSLTNNLNMDEAQQWSDRALQIQKNFNTVGLAARMKQKNGKTVEAIGLAKQTLELGKADKDIEKEQLAEVEKWIAEWSAPKK